MGPFPYRPSFWRFEKVLQCYIFEVEYTKQKTVQRDPSIKNLIFDLGGVILDLSIDHTLQAFTKLSGMDKQKVTDLFHSSKGFEVYEMGMMNDEDFRSFVRTVYGVTSSDEEIDTCWLAMLRGIPVRKLELLERLKNSYRVFLLSNTNNIHLVHINKNMLTNSTSLDQFFHRAYYSHVMKKRKPNADIFQQVLDENGMVAEETLFLDDNLANLEGARALGIKTLHVSHPDIILDYFHEQ